MKDIRVRGFSAQGLVFEDDPSLLNSDMGPIELEEEQRADIIDVTTSIKLKAERRKHYDED